MYVLLKFFDFVRNSINISTALYWNYIFLMFFHKYKFKQNMGIYIFAIVLTIFAITFDSIINYFDILYGKPLEDNESIFHDHF